MPFSSGLKGILQLPFIAGLTIAFYIGTYELVIEHPGGGTILGALVNAYRLPLRNLSISELEGVCGIVVCFGVLE